MAGVGELPVVNLAGQLSLKELAAMIDRASCFIGLDSVPMHIAAAMGIPTLAVFGSTDHVATGPRGDRTSIIRHDVDCAPCLKPECPTDHRCMLSIETEEIWEEMKKMRERFI